MSQRTRILFTAAHTFCSALQCVLQNSFLCSMRVKSSIMRYSSPHRILFGSLFCLNPPPPPPPDPLHPPSDSQVTYVLDKPPAGWQGGAGYLNQVLCCDVLQRVAVCCSVLQCVAVCCSVLQCFVWRWLSQSGAVLHCDKVRVAVNLQGSVWHCVLLSMRCCAAVCCSVLQCVAVCCVCCSVLCSAGYLNQVL